MKQMQIGPKPKMCGITYCLLPSFFLFHFFFSEMLCFLYNRFLGKRWILSEIQTDHFQRFFLKSDSDVHLIADVQKLLPHLSPHSLFRRITGFLVTRIILSKSKIHMHIPHRYWWLLHALKWQQVLACNLKSKHVQPIQKFEANKVRKRQMGMYKAPLYTALKSSQKM